MVKGNAAVSLFIAGLACEYPSYSMTQDQFEEVIKTLYPEYSSSPGLQKLISFNRKTRIASRRIVFDYSKWTIDDAAPPPIDELSRIFRTVGVDLTVRACGKAMQEAKLLATDVTHTVAVTCTDQGNPGYDLLVCQKLQLLPTVQRVLLHGVGCAGGLSALRAAANIAAAASQRGQAARIIVFSCEICSLFFRAELQAAFQDKEKLHIAPALFSDAAAAVIVCNELAVGEKRREIFQLQEWGSMVMPGTLSHMSYEIERNGMIANMSKDVPKTAVSAITPMFNQLCGFSTTPFKLRPATRCESSGFDWALHPGGAAILEGAQKVLQLTDDHIRASLDVYKSYGNSSSTTVLIVLDKLRRMGDGRDRVVAASFGPGLMIEMFIMRRGRDVGEIHSLTLGLHDKIQRYWLAYQYRLRKIRKLIKA
ncbi:thiolase-like protein [Pyrenochaeta sp. MPI-SDFR-AT-0127]|nr:thiolase-like protein [Pyrenochaeta sp. MPI-SDFR-AT-0127]